MSRASIHVVRYYATYITEHFGDLNVICRNAPCTMTNKHYYIYIQIKTYLLGRTKSRKRRTRDFSIGKCSRVTLFLSLNQYDAYILQTTLQSMTSVLVCASCFSNVCSLIYVIDFCEEMTYVIPCSHTNISMALLDDLDDGQKYFCD